jgi:ABC-type protease/lipase transport system fused ATPase/permease subunit
MVSGPAFMACKSNEICTAIQDDISLAAILPACEPAMNMSSQPKTSEELAAGLRACSGYLAAAAAFSVAINLLYLAPPLYMLQISDRVVSSGSIVTPDSTMIRSACRTVLNRCAMMIRVTLSLPREALTTAWALLSSALVASSNNRMRGRRAIARAIMSRSR